MLKMRSKFETEAWRSCSVISVYKSPSLLGLSPCYKDYTLDGVS